MSFLAKPLVPKIANSPLRVIMLGRVSTELQNIENIEASHRYVDRFLEQNYQGAMEVKRLGERASGMRTDRESIMEADELIATGMWDLVIAEDLSRFYRNPRHQYAFVQDAVDAGTRVICIGDNLDTADDNWEVNMGAASLRHGLYIPDTRRRVRRTATDSFHKGGMVAKVIYGYRKLTKEEAKSGQFGPVGLRIAKLPECTPVIQEMRAMVLAGRRYNHISEWLNERRISPGPFSTNGKWTGKLVRDFLAAPILHGTRTFRNVLHQPVFRTGKYKRSKNAQGPETKTYPELAHFTLQEHESLMREMARRVVEHCAPKAGPDHPLANRARSKTIWPGQAIHCSACCELFYWGDNGNLKCRNAFKHGEYQCWNHVQVSAEQVRLKVLPWILSELARIPQAREALIDSAWREYVRVMQVSRNSGLSLDAEIRDLEKRSAKLVKAIQIADEMEALVTELKAVNDALATARKRKRIEQENLPPSLGLGSREDVAEQLDQTIMELSRTSFEFGELMGRWISEIVIIPVQALDSGLVRPRARVTLRLSIESTQSAINFANQHPESVTTTLDLFDPPLHIRHLRACVAEKERNPKIGLKEIAAKLSINHMTVKRAFDYHRLMHKVGLEEPYRELHSKPEKASRWRRRPDQSGTGQAESV